MGLSHTVVEAGPPHSLLTAPDSQVELLPVVVAQKMVSRLTGFLHLASPYTSISQAWGRDPKWVADSFLFLCKCIFLTGIEKRVYLFSEVYKTCTKSTYTHGKLDNCCDGILS